MTDSLQLSLLLENNNLSSQARRIMWEQKQYKNIFKIFVSQDLDVSGM